MSNRSKRRLSRDGFTIWEIVVAVVIVLIVVTFVGVAISNSDPLHKALKARAQALCDSTAKASPDSFAITVAEIPQRVERDLGVSLSPVRSRYFHWRRGDPRCEIQYCYIGRDPSSMRLAKTCTTWEAI